MQADAEKKRAAAAAEQQQRAVKAAVDAERQRAAAAAAELARESARVAAAAASAEQARVAARLAAEQVRGPGVGAILLLNYCVLEYFASTPGHAGRCRKTACSSCSGTTTARS